MGEGGFVIMVGLTRANWAHMYTGGGTDFMAVSLDAENGTNEEWRWQVRDERGSSPRTYPTD